MQRPVDLSTFTEKISSYPLISVWIAFLNEWYRPYPPCPSSASPQRLEMLPPRALPHLLRLHRKLFSCPFLRCPSLCLHTLPPGYPRSYYGPVVSSESLPSKHPPHSVS